MLFALGLMGVLSSRRGMQKNGETLWSENVSNKHPLMGPKWVARQNIHSHRHRHMDMAIFIERWWPVPRTRRYISRIPFNDIYYIYFVWLLLFFSLCFCSDKWHMILINAMAARFIEGICYVMAWWLTLILNNEYIRFFLALFERLLTRLIWYKIKVGSHEWFSKLLFQIFICFVFKNKGTPIFSFFW